MKVTIPSGQSLSGVVNLSGQTLVGIQMPAGWDAAALSFQAANDDDGPFTDMHTVTGTEVSMTVAAARWIAINPADFAGPLAIKVRSGMSAAAVNQTAARELLLVTREV